MTGAAAFLQALADAAGADAVPAGTRWRCCAPRPGPGSCCAPSPRPGARRACVVGYGIASDAVPVQMLDRVRTPFDVDAAARARGRAGPTACG
ncbi:hypothetical protein [Xylophilus ampelinus]|uniref:hypothetical protein n=1 Tax=Xylophilus ampelinus TaxID=54067 RepID=UPI0035BC84F6